jgi:very-short-patch-repair endonuclease/succinate dehydrogenase flavin-adding protein (antitoxin of CptAB toxin-antitoxin module)
MRCSIPLSLDGRGDGERVMRMSNTRQIFAKQLRGNMTDAEKLLWYHLRGHRFNGAKFKRQQPMGDYIVDFICFEAKLVIEVDGGQHLESKSDEQRDDWLKGQGFRILRFWNNEVLRETESVLEKIYHAITPSPPPLSHEGRGEVEAALSDHSLSSEGKGGKQLQRVRWRSRRGLLELDIVLGRFIDKHYAQLDEAGQQAFEALLDMPDNPLWDMIAGRQEAMHGEQQALLEKIRAA